MAPSIFVASARFADANDCLLQSKVERVALFLQFYRPPDGVSASVDAEGKLHLTVSNANLHKDVAVTVFARGLEGGKVEGRVLHAATMNAHNTFEQPDVVKPRPFRGAKLAAEGLEIAVPKMAVVALSVL